MIELVEIEPGRWRVKRDRGPVARSAMPFPNVISDEMDPTEQVDGKFYTSKAKFRAVGRALGLTEVGNEKIKPVKYRELNKQKLKKQRRESIEKAVARYRNGERIRA